MCWLKKITTYVHSVAYTPCPPVIAVCRVFLSLYIQLSERGVCVLCARGNTHTVRASDETLLEKCLRLSVNIQEYSLFFGNLGQFSLWMGK
jgi:hypothetical protein